MHACIHIHVCVCLYEHVVYSFFILTQHTTTHFKNKKQSNVNEIFFVTGFLQIGHSDLISTQLKGSNIQFFLRSTQTWHWVCSKCVRMCVCGCMWCVWVGARGSRERERESIGVYMYFHLCVKRE